MAAGTSAHFSFSEDAALEHEMHKETRLSIVTDGGRI
jgi:hypothetical protein